MNSQRLEKRYQRKIVRRIIVRGCLELTSPTCLGSGDADSLTDMPLLRDSVSDRALLTGASLAGALRNYLREYLHGYGVSESKSDLATKLFGSVRQDEDGAQSPLIVDDALSSDVPKIELRDGVKIDSQTGTAEDKKKYDLELLAAGTQFPLQFELLITQQDEPEKLLQGLAIALQGLEKSEINLGMKKRRGFGCCVVKEWQVWDFDLRDPAQCRAWLEYSHWQHGFLPEPPEKQLSITTALGVNLENIDDCRKHLKISATFSLNDSLLIRSGQAEIGSAPDVVHLKSQRDGEWKPVLSGTSLAGVLRHRAERILNTLSKNNQDSEILNGLFGYVNEDKKIAQSSRLIVREAEISSTSDMVQSRIAIDRFTGGAYHGALFDEQPVWGDDNTRVTLDLELRNPEKHEIGLLLLLLKDLWTEDLPVGGESSIGRGRLKGREAEIDWATSRSWKISRSQGRLLVQDLQNSAKPEGEVKKELEEFVQALVDLLSGEA